MKNKTNAKQENNHDNALFHPGDIWSLLYPVVEHWRSDFKFFEDELNFFRLLIDKHLSLLIDAKNIEHTRTMVGDVTNLEEERVRLSTLLADHAHGMASLAENPFIQNAKGCKNDHVKLESEVAEFAKKFRAVKGEVFKITEQAIHSDKARRMIDWA